jgi:glucuronoarabinoxylan endo-1,4-beta-xylanase
LRSRRWPYIAAPILFLAVLAGLYARRRVEASSPVTIHWDTEHQTIDGFGASATGYSGMFTPEQADRFFDPEIGLGLSLLRLNAIPSTVRDDCYCVSNSPGYHCVLGNGIQVLAGDLRVAQLATQRGVQVFASPWSPPAEMKTSGKFCGVGSMKSDPGLYAAYAERMARFPQLLEANGVSLTALSVQNEPDTENDGYDTCRWTGRQIHDFIPYLSDALSKAGAKNLKIAAPEESEWAFDLLSETVKDPAVDGKVGLILGHGYHSGKPSGLPEVGDRHVWQSETSEYTKFDGSIEDGLRWAESIHDYMAIGANAWMFWNLDCGEHFYNQSSNMCLTDQKGRLAKRAFVVGQFAKFIRPGWRRIGVANPGDLMITAYKGSDKKFAIVVINTSWVAKRDQEFIFRGAISSNSSIRPWITSSASSLEHLTPVSFNATTGSVSYTIPGKSVVTLVGQLD